MSGPTLTITRTTQPVGLTRDSTVTEITLTRSELGVQGLPGAAASISDTPTNGVVDVGISSNWAYDHQAAADPHPRYALESALGTAAATNATAYATAAQGATADTAVQLSAANIRAVSIQAGNYPLLAADSVVVFTATATATLPAATGSGRTYRLVCRTGTLTIDPAGSETVKGATTAVLSAGEDLIITDTATGAWE